MGTLRRVACLTTFLTVMFGLVHRTHAEDKPDRAHADRLTAYLAKSFPNQISAIRVDANGITIEGQIDAASSGLQLAEIGMWDDITAIQSPLTLLPIHADERGRFSVHVDRMAEGTRDRLLSGWAVVKQVDSKYEAMSAMRYVDKQVPRAELPPAKPRSLKGIGGCPFSHPDMQALGISSVTLNIVLNDFIGTQAGAGRSEYKYAGRTWSINDGVVARYDRDMKTAAEHGWMVSAIILLRPVRNSPPGAWIRDAAHPDADPKGAYVMPNFTTRAGVEAYAAAMNFLAERYSRPDGKFGRIHDWIMHNEISSGYYWTTAGNKTLITYLDLYQKSMRVAYLLARQYDPNAKPLISLDHFWALRSDPRAYPGRELLEKLVDFSRQEGDFPWAIAFHPYAQDLFNPRTWEDKQSAFAFDTPMITFKNLEVLDAWVEQPRVEYLGKTPREIQLTEQGLNSRNYSEKALAEQAAGLAYAWKKIEPLKHVTAFQYHLWADARKRGGLRLGLRKFSNEPGDPFGKKPSWRVFQAMGTDQWDAATRFALPMIGIHDWSEVHHGGQIR